MSPRPTRVGISAVVALAVSCVFMVAGGEAKSPNKDTRPPTAPSGLNVGSTTTTGMTLSWQPSKDNVAVAGYTIYVNGKAVATAP